MGFDTLNSVVFAVAFLVPGFIWTAVLSLLVPRSKRDPQVRVLGFLTLSCVNNGLWSWLVYLIWSGDWYKAHPAASAGVVLLVLLVSPVALALVTGRLRQKETLARALQRVGFDTVHSVSTAWDFQFGQTESYWVIVALKDGSRIYGLFGVESFAGDNVGGRDLYLERVARLLEDGAWHWAEDTGGVWIASDQIASVEFKQIPEVEEKVEEKVEGEAL